MSRVAPVLMILALAASWGLMACGGDDSAPSAEGNTPHADANRSDPQNLVSFAAPEDWMERRTPSRVRYEPVATDPLRSVINVEVHARSEIFTPEEYMEQLDGKMEIQEHAKLSDDHHTRDGAEIYEAVYEIKTPHGPDTLHQVVLFYEDLRVEVQLHARDGAYEAHLPQLRRVVESITPTGGTPH